MFDVKSEKVRLDFGVLLMRLFMYFYFSKWVFMNALHLLCPPRNDVHNPSLRGGTTWQSFHMNSHHEITSVILPS